MAFPFSDFADEINFFLMNKKYPNLQIRAFLF